MEATRRASSGLTPGESATSRALRAGSSAEGARLNPLGRRPPAPEAGAANGIAAATAKTVTLKQSRRAKDNIIIWLDSAIASPKKRESTPGKPAKVFRLSSRGGENCSREVPRRLRASG